MLMLEKPHSTITAKQVDTEAVGQCETGGSIVISSRHVEAVQRLKISQRIQATNNHDELFHEPLLPQKAPELPQYSQK